ncbi:MAG: sigma-E processing peptidase SpoIIGA [Clostridia bacterium]|nr:sigma-E processing peptidase SpoIIGA [Clostridia bacterium]
MVIYIDMLLALNWWIDFLLLLAVRRAMGGNGKSWRLAVGALVGAFSCLVLFLPPVSVWVSLLIRLSAAALMVSVAFGIRQRHNWIRSVILLFALSAGLAGVCGAFYFFLAPQGFYVFNGVVYYSIPPLLLVGLTVLCYGLLWLFEQVLRRRAPREHLYRVRIAYAGRSVTFSCLYDSGNHLTEPFSGKPVLVVERQVAEALLTYIPAVSDLPAGWRLVPYNTLGGNGLLPAFQSADVTAFIQGSEHPLPACYVAVCDSLGKGEYQGLMGADMAENLARKDGKALCFTD